MHAKAPRLPTPIDAAFRIAIVATLWLLMFREWTASGDGTIGLAARMILLLIVTGWAIRAWRYRGH